MWGVRVRRGRVWSGGGCRRRLGGAEGGAGRSKGGGWEREGGVWLLDEGGEGELASPQGGVMSSSFIWKGGEGGGGVRSATDLSNFHQNKPSPPPDLFLLLLCSSPLFVSTTTPTRPLCGGYVLFRLPLLDDLVQIESPSITNEEGAHLGQSFVTDYLGNHRKVLTIATDS